MYKIYLSLLDSKNNFPTLEYKGVILKAVGLATVHCQMLCPVVMFSLRNKAPSTCKLEGNWLIMVCNKVKLLVIKFKWSDSLTCVSYSRNLLEFTADEKIKMLIGTNHVSQFGVTVLGLKDITNYTNITWQTCEKCQAGLAANIRKWPLI